MLKTDIRGHAERVNYVAELALIIPTFNELDNIEPLLEKIRTALAGIDWEVIFVDDDSPDGTSKMLRNSSQSDFRVRMLHRVGRRGLSSAVVEGILSTSAPFVAVMDADMQHDERLLPKMFRMLCDDEADIVVGSRYVSDGSVGNWDKKRQLISKVATNISHLIMKASLKDPMSGFFMVKRDVFDAALPKLSIKGYKILLDIVASAPGQLRIAELPYTFGIREHGESKLDTLVSVEFVTLILDKLVGRWVPVKLIFFGVIGLFGLALHMGILAFTMITLGVAFLISQTVATISAMTFNFFLNNTLTHRDRKLTGVGSILYGLASFYVVCGVGAVANVGIANYLYVDNYSWWISAIAGIIVGAGWNYGASSFYTWGNK